MIGMKIWFLQERFIKPAANLIAHQNKIRRVYEIN